MLKIFVKMLLFVGMDLGDRRRRKGEVGKRDGEGVNDVEGVNKGCKEDERGGDIGLWVS